MTRRLKKKRNHRTCKKLIHQPNYATSANYPLHSRKPTPSIHLEQSLFAAARRGNTVGNETSPCTLFSRLSPPHTTPDGETRSVKNQTPLTFENFLARWSGTTFSLSRDRWTRVKRVRGGKERGGPQGEKDTVCWTGWRMERDGRGGMERRGRVERRGLARRSARTTRSICMLGDVDHVGRGWPATGGCWLANGHPKATPTPTHGVLKPRRSDNHPIYLGEQPPQKQRDVGGGCYRWMHDANTLYTPLTLLPNSVESSKIENRLVFTFVFLLFSFSWLFYRMGGGWGRIMSPSLHHDGMIRLSRCLGNTVLEFWRNWFSYLLFLFPVGC